MYITCLDLEGVLVPEIWIAFAEETGIEELRLTTRDISDYNVLMNKRIDILKAHKLKLKDIQNTIEKINPMDGAKNFLDNLRELSQVVILSDTFTEFALPLMKKLGMPTIFCNSLTVSEDGFISGYKLRQDNGKYHAVKGFQSMGYKIIASGDSYNDIEMIKQAEKGFLFRSPKHIQEEYKEFQSFVEYDELYQAIKREIQEK
ncbi:MAG TPA: bifunctional phosphoserine phosphatase/homoserine phosphotransferase ThrH [Treponemataceae bacterium]|nr:bifunctional phosphoserine phosphatase/homoserine phosphotransferase ThrH [Treponemataceae bacterium]